jgi:succinate dehydrogenase / fumarate reductase cytochrome b subunit
MAGVQRALALTDTTIGKKAVLAVTGVVLFGYVLVHMAGNLVTFAGPEAYNAYAAAAKGNPVVLWGVRAVLFVALVVHVALVIELYMKTLRARPVRYRVKRNVATSYAASAMKYSGPALMLYVIFHLAHFTYPGISFGAYDHSPTDVYNNFVGSFGVPWLVGVYVSANLLLGMHLYHGAFSLLQSLGLSHPKYDGKLRGTSRGFAFLVTAGNLALPLSVYFGLMQ